jgi:hypothetical protein
LRDELPELVEGGVLDTAAAERLTQHYALSDVTQSDAGAMRTLVLALLGCLLIGAGVILLFAHNWDELSRPTRAAVSLGQLLVAQAFAAYALWRSPSLVEGAGSLLTLSIGAAIALISQTYHLEGELGDFMLAWIALAAPLVYVLGARFVATLVLCGAPVLAFERTHAFDHGFAYLLAIALVAPALALRTHAQLASGLSVLARWALVFTLPFASLPLIVHDMRAPWLPFYAGLAACHVALGAELERGATFLRRPLSIAGGLGAVVLLLVLSYEDAYGDLFDMHHAKPHAWLGLAAYAMTFATLAGAAVLALPALKKREPDTLALLASLGLALLFYVGVRSGMHATALAMIANLALFALGSALLGFGLARGSASLSNKGLGTLAVLFTARFFDTEWSFVARGIGFLLLGLAFIGVNVALGRKKKEASV